MLFSSFHWVRWSAVEFQDYTVEFERAHLNEPSKILGILPPELLAVVHAELGLQYRVDAQSARAEDGFWLRCTQDSVQTRISESA